MPSLFSLLITLLIWATTTTASAAAVTATSISTIKFLNHWPYPLYFWTVGPNITQFPSHDLDHTLVPPHGGSIMSCDGTWHVYSREQGLGLGGISLRIYDQLYYEVAPAGIIQVEYTFEPSKNHIWYDLSAIDCNHAAGPQDPEFCPFVGGGVKVHVPGSMGSQCPPPWCVEGKCWSMYLKHGSWLGEPSFMCDAGAEVLVETCTEGVGPRTFGDGDRPVRSGGLSLDGTCGVNSAGRGRGYM